VELGLRFQAQILGRNKRQNSELVFNSVILSPIDCIQTGVFICLEACEYNIVGGMAE
jgi:hypothetical protein